VTFPQRASYPYAATKEAAEAAVRASGLAFTVVRPTIILGPGAPVLAGLRRLALLPVIPVFGRRNARVQPIDVDDLAQLLEALLEPGSFQGQTLELGGPEVLGMIDLLQEIRRASRGGSPGRVLRLPLAPIATLLRICAGAGLRLPLTAGQLSSFASDGVAEPNEFSSRRRAALTPLATTLQRSLAAGVTA
jgi:uncharacterized protein YbjT (DUF2867 family)